MATIKLISWNCQGLRLDSPQTFQKMYFLQTQYPQQQFDVLALLETHHTSDADLPPSLKNTTSIIILFIPLHPHLITIVE